MSSSSRLGATPASCLECYASPFAASLDFRTSDLVLPLGAAMRRMRDERKTDAELEDMEEEKRGREREREREIQLHILP